MGGLCVHRGRYPKGGTPLFSSLSHLVHEVSDFSLPLLSGMSTRGLKVMHDVHLIMYWNL
jgi:hypothetical protein